jgi:predicted MFS family arabinose efflux permease
MAIAFMVNIAAYPVPLGLLPYVAKEIYHTDQAGLGYLAASFATGALAGSLILSWVGHALRPARMMIVYSAAWYAANLVFAHTPQLAAGIAVLMLSGLAQSLCLVPMSAMLLRGAEERFRGGVMGVRMLMIYGLPVGLMVSGPLIGALGFATTITLYSAIGLASTALIAWRWSAHVWRGDAPGNAR